jgi:hypothetical protein
MSFKRKSIDNYISSKSGDFAQHGVSFAPSLKKRKINENKL